MHSRIFHSPWGFFGCIIFHMEKNTHDFEEEYVPGQRRKPNPAKRISLGAAAMIAIGIAAACIVRARELYPYAEPTPAPMVTPDPTFAAEPTTEPTPAAGAIQPADTASIDTGYVATAIMVDGKCIGVLASREAAEEVLDEAVSSFELKINLPGSMDSYITNEVELTDAANDADAAAMECMTYEAMLMQLTGGDTPITVETTLSERHTEIVPHDEKAEKDDYLIKGTRMVVNYGTDGESRTVITTKYINGVQHGKSESETFEISQRVDALIREGTIKADGHAEPGKREGAKGPNAGELSFMRPTKSGEITENFGQLKGVLHLGLDFAAKEGDEVYAAAAGTIVCVTERGGYGLVVEIAHEGGFLTRYANLSAANVALGDAVNRGDAIALAGSSGNADRAKLHFELRHNGIAYNPRGYFNS